jgi:hypothetical protein
MPPYMGDWIQTTCERVETSPLIRNEPVGHFLYGNAKNSRQIRALHQRLSPIRTVRHH